MNPASAYPCPIPLARDAAARFLRGDPSFAALRGAYLCFVMIAVEERIGEWRYAGAATSQAEILSVLAAFNDTLCAGEPPPDFSYADWVEQMDMDLQGSWSFDSLPLGPPEERAHQVILFAEGGAPYDDAGLAIIEIPSLAASSFAGRAPETQRPPAWDGEVGDEDEDDEDDDL